MLVTVVEIIANLALVAVDIFIAILFTEMIELILQKNRSWISFLLAVLGIIMLQASVYSWLPGRLGYSVQLFEGAITLQDGAVLSNLGAILLVQAIAIGLVLLKHIWSVIRRKNRFSGKFFALELLFLLLFGTAGVLLFENEAVIAFSGEPSRHSLLLILLFAGGLLLTVAGVRGIKKMRNRT